jgi:hypothetical protein
LQERDLSGSGVIHLFFSKKECFYCARFGSKIQYCGISPPGPRRCYHTWMICVFFISWFLGVETKNDKSFSRMYKKSNPG